MVKALEKTGTTVPNYLALLSTESSTHPSRLKEEVYSMHCFWTGEATLGSLDGDLETEAGFLHGREVVRVAYDPNIIETSQLSETAKQAGFHPIEKKGQAVRPDHQPKYYLSNHLLSYLPMTPLQATRVNAALGISG